jgi:hypothetical protein
MKRTKINPWWFVGAMLLCGLAGMVQAQTVATPVGGGTTLTDSASLRTALSDETGSGLAVFATSPTFTTQVLMPDGSAGTPSIGFSSDTDTGIRWSGTDNDLRFVAGGTDRFRIASNVFQMRSGGTIEWSSGAIAAASDLILARDAAGILAQRDGTNAQNFRIYKTYTDASNYERLNISGTTITLQKAGTGGDNDLIINNGTGFGIKFQTSGNTRWNINNSGHLLPETDITYDIGANGATRPRDVFVGGNLNLGATTELTIASGVITITRSYHRIDTESDGASDDLDTISGGITGDTLVLRAENDARTVVVKDGTGNIQTAGDCTLDNVQDTITLIFDGTNWLETARSNNGA